jgi:hypothetical protein
MPGEPAGRTAARVDHIDVVIRAVLHGEGNLLAVGREMGIGFRAGEARQPPGVATVLADDPDIAGIRERDLRRADGGLAQEARALRVHGRCDE